MKKYTIKSGIVIFYLTICSVAAEDEDFRPAEPLVNLGDTVNTASDDLYPAISGDGKTIIFSARRDGQVYYDLYESKLIDGVWSVPRRISELSSAYNDESPYLTAEGDLILFASDRDGSFEMPADGHGRIKVSFDIYWSKRTANGWSNPVKIPGNVNSVHHERFPSLSADRKTLYYSSWPFGQLRGATVRKSTFSGGKFDEGEDLPAVINSGNQEVQFVPNRAGEGFFFTSQRPGGFGGWDIYFIKQGPDGRFLNPVNLGPNVNSAGHEATISVSLNGDIVVSSSRPGGAGRYDIYGAVAKEENRIITIKTIDKETKKPVSVVIDLEAASDLPLSSIRGKELQKKTDEKGELKVTVNPAVRSLVISVAHENYLPVRLVSRPEKESILIELEKTEEGKSFSVNDIKFDYNSSEIRSESFGYLSDLAEYLRRNPGIHLEIIGHTDMNASHQFNDRLSAERAEAVRKYLTDQGISQNRLTAKGAGKRQPLIPEISETADAKNRRTEFRIVSR